MAKKNNEILEKGTKRTKGSDALYSNIDAARAISLIVKSTLGPMGMDKMLIDQVGNTIITNDGVKILQEMHVEHPGAKLLVNVAKTQEQEVGDGTTTAVILSGEFLTSAKKLIEEKKVHPTNIVRVYQMCAKEALKILNYKSNKISINDEIILRQIAQTAMIGKGAEFSKEHLSKILVDAIKIVSKNNTPVKKKIKITKATGGDINDSNLVSGIVLDKNLSHPNMPNKIKNGKVLLLDFPLEVRELDTDANVQLNSYDEYDNFVQSEKKYLKAIADKIKKIGANFVVSQKGIDDEVAYYLAKENIMAVRRTRKSDLEKLSFALNTKIVSSIDDLSKKSLGSCEVIEKKEILGEDYIFVEGCINPQAVTLFLKGSTEHVLDELERAVEDSLGDLNSVLKEKSVVAGGGAIELEIHKELIEYVNTFESNDRIIAKSFARSFLCIPKILSNNSGLDSKDIIKRLIKVHSLGDEKAGISGNKGIVKDTLKEGIVEPISVKSQAIKSAIEASVMILRIDDVIAAKKLDQEELRPEYQEY